MNIGAGSRGLVPPLLRDQVFRRYWGASTVSMFGDQVSSVALPLTAVLVLHADAAEMGYLTALQWLPSLLFGLHAGAWVDRRGTRRHSMILADLGRAAALATIPLCYGLHALTMTQMYLVTFATGTLSVLFTVSDGTLFVSIVPPGRYVGGQSLIYGSRSLSLMGGPSVGGLLVEALTAPYAVFADALSFLGSAFQLGTIRPVEPPSADAADGVTAGLKFIRGSPIVRASLSGVAVAAAAVPAAPVTVPGPGGGCRREDPGPGGGRRQPAFRIFECARSPWKSTSGPRHSRRRRGPACSHAVAGSCWTRRSATWARRA